MTAVFLVALLLPATTSPEELTLPVKVAGPARATLSIRVAEQTPQQGTARVRYRLFVEGPADFAIDGPWLEDALSAWQVTTSLSSFALDSPSRWECTLELLQRKPGMVPLPGIRLRIRSGNTSPSLNEEVSWPDPLHEPADVADIQTLPPLPPSGWPDRLRLFLSLCLAVTLIGGLGWISRRWLRRSPIHPRPDRVALDEIDRALTTPNLAVSLRGVAVDMALRRYLESLSIPAQRLTTLEILSLTERLPFLSPDNRSLLESLLNRLQEAKFAGSPSLAHLETLAHDTCDLIITLEQKKGSGWISTQSTLPA